MQKLYALGVGHTGNFYHFFIQAIFILSQTPWLVDPNCANKLSTRFKAPYTSSEYKVLDVISKTLTFARNLAFWGAVWGPVHNLHPLWQGKSTFLNLPQSTSASGYKHYKCHITMLQHNFQLPKRWSGWGDRAKMAYWHNLTRKGRFSHGDDQLWTPDCVSFGCQRAR